MTLRAEQPQTLYAALLGSKKMMRPHHSHLARITPMPVRPAAAHHRCREPLLCYHYRSYISAKTTQETASQKWAALCMVLLIFAEIFNYGSRCGLGCLAGSELCISYVYVAGSDNIRICCDLLERSVNRVCNTGKEVDKTTCCFLVCVLKVENYSSSGNEVICDLSYAVKGLRLYDLHLKCAAGRAGEADTG